MGSATHRPSKEASLWELAQEAIKHGEAYADAEKDAVVLKRHGVAESMWTEGLSERRSRYERARERYRAAEAKVRLPKAIVRFYIWMRTFHKCTKEQFSTTKRRDTGKGA